MKISRLAILVCAFLATPLLARAQETKLVHCRSIEAAGNFVGPDEVIDGDRVCKKAKPGDAATANVEPEKPAPATSAIPSTEPVSVAEAARANAAAKTAAKKAAAQKEPEALKPAQMQPQALAEPAKSATRLPAAAASNAVPGAPPAEPIREPQPAGPAPLAQPVVAQPVVAQPPAAPAPSVPASPTAAPVALAASEPPAASSTDEPGPAFTSANAPVTRTQRVATPVNSIAAPTSTAAATPVRVHRDAPVAPGTPSEPPEIDHGFFDANAVEAPAAVGNGAASTRTAQSSDRKVQLGGLDNPDAKSAASPEGTAACAKNITLGSLRDGQLSLAAPAWAEKWIANNQSHLANVCFSSAPQAGARNYLIVFYVAPSGQSGANAAMPLPDSSGGAGEFTTKDGSSWHYSAERADSTAYAASGTGTVTQVWYATAYTETGAPVAERWPDSSKLGDGQRASEDLLDAVVEDLRKL